MNSSVLARALESSMTHHAVHAQRCLEAATAVLSAGDCPRKVRARVRSRSGRNLAAERAAAAQYLSVLQEALNHTGILWASRDDHAVGTHRL